MCYGQIGKLLIVDTLKVNIYFVAFNSHSSDSKPFNGLRSREENANARVLDVEDMDVDQTGDGRAWSMNHMNKLNNRTDGSGPQDDIFSLDIKQELNRSIT